MSNKKAFLSHAYENKQFAEVIARTLLENGVDVWFDKWEINLGDSLIQRIFMEGLADCDVFLILLSKASTQSKWVKEELDAALVSRIEGVTKIIPIMQEECEIPLPLRPLLRIDLSENFDQGIRKIVKAIYSVNDKPPIGHVPDYITELFHGVGGLSKTASTIGMVIVNQANDEVYEKVFGGKELLQLVNGILSLEELNDGIEELEEYGLVRVTKTLGTAPFKFYCIEATYALYIHFQSEYDEFNPMHDVKIVVAAIASAKKLSGPELQSISRLPSKRINRAVDYLEDYGLIRVQKFLGTAPFNFGDVEATQKTRVMAQTMK